MNIGFNKKPELIRLSSACALAENRRSTTRVLENRTLGQSVNRLQSDVPCPAWIDNQRFP